MEEEKITWSKKSKVHWKGVIDKQQIYLIDEACCFDFKFPKSDGNWNILPIFTDEDE